MSLCARRGRRGVIGRKRGIKAVTMDPVSIFQASPAILPPTTVVPLLLHLLVPVPIFIHPLPLPPPPSSCFPESLPCPALARPTIPVSPAQKLKANTSRVSSGYLNSRWLSIASHGSECRSSWKRSRPPCSHPPSETESLFFNEQRRLRASHRKEKERKSK